MRTSVGPPPRSLGPTQTMCRFVPMTTFQALTAVSRVGAAQSGAGVAYRGGWVTAQRSSAGRSHDISATVAMPLMMHKMSSSIAFTSICFLGTDAASVGNAKGVGRGAGRFRRPYQLFDGGQETST